MMIYSFLMKVLTKLYLFANQVDIPAVDLHKINLDKENSFDEKDLDTVVKNAKIIQELINVYSVVS